MTDEFEALKIVGSLEYIVKTHVADGEVEKRLLEKLSELTEVILSKPDEPVDYKEEFVADEIDQRKRDDRDLYGEDDDD